jgi:hypothetical protein
MIPNFSLLAKKIVNRKRGRKENLIRASAGK